MAFGDPKPEGGNKAAEGILTQMKGLCNQYQALGEGTPLFEESKRFEADIDQALDQVKGGGPDEGATPELDGKSSPPASFRDATKAASDAMKADGNFIKNHGESKASPFGDDEEQTPEDEEKKKKGTKAFSS